MISLADYLLKKHAHSTCTMFHSPKETYIVYQGVKYTVKEFEEKYSNMKELNKITIGRVKWKGENSCKKANWINGGKSY